MRSVDKAVKACPPGSGPAVQWIIRELLDGAKSWKDQYRGHRNRRPVYVPEVLFGSMAKRPGLKEGVAASNQLVCDAMDGLYFEEKDLGDVEEQPAADAEVVEGEVVVPEADLRVNASAMAPARAAVAAAQAEAAAVTASRQ